LNYKILNNFNLMAADERDYERSARGAEPRNKVGKTDHREIGKGIFYGNFFKLVPGIIYVFRGK
jgi:hypothetical protein